MPLPTLQEWKNKTKEGILQRRGNNITPIDECLASYLHATRVRSPDANKKCAAALLALIKACNKWLKTKILKGGGTSALHRKRKAEITNLGAEAIKEFNRLLTQITDNQLRAQGSYEAHRLGTFQKGAAAATQTKPLALGYQPERQIWLEGGKVSNISGTAIHTGGVTQIKKGPLDQNFQPLAVPQKMKNLVNKDAGSLTAADWRAIQTFCIDNQIDYMDKNNTQCKYMRQTERLVALVFINAGKLEDFDGNLISCNSNKANYAMDRYGNFYTDQFKSIQWGGMSRNHSSMLAGSDVICAGEVLVENGELKLINNTSGHYQPTKQNLTECVKLLDAEGADLSQTKVSVIRYERGREVVDVWNSGHNFLTKTAKPDIPG